MAFVLMRKATQTFARQGFQVPQGAMVLVAPCVSHRMPDVFSDPHQYRPERFSSEHSEHDESSQPHSLIGFGGGVHRCAGVNFAYLEMKIVLSFLLQHYEFTLLDPHPQPARGAVTKWPASPCLVQYRRRVNICQKTARQMSQVGEGLAAESRTGHCPIPH